METVTNLGANNLPDAIRRYREGWERAFGRSAQLALDLDLKYAYDPRLLSKIPPSASEIHTILMDLQGREIGHLYGLEVKDGMR